VGAHNCKLENGNWKLFTEEEIMLFKKLCLFVTIIAVTSLICITQVAAQTPSSKSSNNQKTAPPPPGAKSQTSAVSDAAASSDDVVIDDGAQVRDIMRRFRDTYRLGPDDELAIRVLKQPDYTLERVKVSPVGSIFHPLLGEINVAGLTVEQLKKQLMIDFSEYVLDPTVYIELLVASSAKIGVMGEIVRPGILVMTRPMTVTDAIVEAGGITDMGKKSGVTVVRQSLDGNRQLLTVNVKKIFEGKAKPEENIALQAGDTVIVHGNTMKALTKITSVTGLASLLTFLSIGGGGR
jgi:polysaccharide biosynthesis/export protein